MTLMENFEIFFLYDPKIQVFSEPWNFVFFLQLRLNCIISASKKLMFFCAEAIFLPHFLSIRIEIDTFDVKNKSSGIYRFRILIKSKFRFL